MRASLRPQAQGPHGRRLRTAQPGLSRGRSQTCAPRPRADRRTGEVICRLLSQPPPPWHRGLADGFAWPCWRRRTSFEGSWYGCLALGCGMSHDQLANRGAMPLSEALVPKHAMGPNGLLAALLGLASRATELRIPGNGGANPHQQRGHRPNDGELVMIAIKVAASVPPRGAASWVRVMPDT